MKKSKAETKRFVVLDTGVIIDLATYGMGSWGSNSQYGIKIKGSKVYKIFWEYGGEWQEDINDEVLLGKIVYQSNKPFYVLESDVSSTIIKPDYKEYGAKL